MRVGELALPFVSSGIGWASQDRAAGLTLMVWVWEREEWDPEWCGTGGEKQ